MRRAKRDAVLSVDDRSSFTIPRSDVSTNRLVTVARYNTEGDAQVAKMQLEDADIPCVIANAEQSGLPMVFDSSRAGVQVKVHASRVDEARAVLGADDDTD